MRHSHFKKSFDTCKMEELKVLAVKYVVPPSEERDTEKDSLSQILKGLFDRNYTLLAVVEALEFALTSKEHEKRRKGTQLLAELLHRLHIRFLTEQEAKIVSAFFLDRLKDHHAIQPSVIFGLLGIISYQSFPPSSVLPLLQEIFGEIHAQSLTQADRRNLYNILDNLLSNYLLQIRDMGPDFVMGFIQIMDGEKDPRNLILCFDIVGKIIESLNFDVFAEDLFEVTSCYFPVVFNPPPGNPENITREMLVLGLRKSLCATRKFAEYFLPLLSEKIASDIAAAKLDAIETLAECVLHYQASDLASWYELLWNQLSEECVANSDKRISDACVQAIGNIATALNEDKKKETRNRFLNLAVNYFINGLKVSDLKDLEIKSRMLQLVLTKRRNTLLPKVVHALVEALPSLKTDSQKASALQAVATVIGYKKYCSLTKSNLQEDDISFLFAFIQSSDTLLQLASLALCTALTCCFELIEMLPLLINPLLNTLLILEDVDLNLCLNYLTYIVNTFKQVTYDVIIPYVKNHVCTVLYKQTELKKRTIFKIFATLLSHGEVNRLFFLFLKEEGEKLCFKLKTGTECTDQIKYFLNLCHVSLEEIFAKKLISDELFFNALCVAQMIFYLSIVSIHCGKFNTELEDLSKSIIKLTGSMFNGYYQSKFLNYIQNLFKDCSEPCFNKMFVVDQMTTEAEVEHATDNNPIGDPGILDFESKEQVCVASILEPLVVCLHTSIDPAFVNSLFEWYYKLLHSTVMIGLEPLETYPGAMALPSMLNKEKDEDKVTLWSNKLIDLVKHVVDETNRTLETRQKFAKFLILIYKALIIKWHKGTDDLISGMTQYLFKDNIMNVFAEGFGIILSNDDIFQNSNHTVTRPIYRQRFIQSILPKLFHVYEETEDHREKSITIALSNIFKSLPERLLIRELPRVLPILINSLAQDDEEILLATLDTLYSVMAGGQESLSQHVTSIIPKLLSLIAYENSMTMRIRSLRALRLLSTYPAHLIYPFRNEVMKNLKSRLDDKKRLVRKEAVRCRNEWCLVVGGT